MSRRRTFGRRVATALVAAWTVIAGLFARRNRRQCLIASVRGMERPRCATTDTTAPTIRAF